MTLPASCGAAAAPGRRASAAEAAAAPQVRPFAGIVQDSGAPDAELLCCIGERLRLPGTPAPFVFIDGRCGFVSVDAGEIVGEGNGLREAWRSWKRDAVHHLYTEFSFAAWDGEELFCARDRFGTRPFYYARTGRALVFSSVLEAVLAHPDVRTELHPSAIADYLKLGLYDDASATVYAHVRRLPPAHVFDGRGIRRYWTLPEPPRVERDAMALEAALKDAIRDRVTSNNAVVFMSGGLDSPALAALTREVRPETKLLAATTVYRARIVDVEEPYAREAAQSIGVEHRAFPLDDFPPLQSLQEGLWTAEPGPLLTAAATRALYAEAAQHAPIALHGHPADGVLFADLQAHLHALPLARRVAAMLRYTMHRRRPPYFYFRGLWSGGRFGRRNWILGGRSGRRSTRPAQEPLASAMWSSYFEWAHPLFTRAPIELVYPWCDPRVIEAARALDPVPWLVDKHVLREILRGRVSERVRTRPKTFVQGDPWRVPLPADVDLTISAAAPYVDRERFAETIRREGALADETLRAIVLEHWLRLLPDRLRSLRCA